MFTYYNDQVLQNQVQLTSQMEMLNAIINKDSWYIAVWLNYTHTYTVHNYIVSGRFRVPF